MGNVNCLCGGFGKEKKEATQLGDNKFVVTKQFTSTVVPEVPKSPPTPPTPDTPPPVSAVP